MSEEQPDGIMSAELQLVNLKRFLENYIRQTEGYFDMHDECGDYVKGVKAGFDLAMRSVMGHMNFLSVFSEEDLPF